MAGCEGRTAGVGPQIVVGVVEGGLSLEGGGRRLDGLELVRLHCRYWISECRVDINITSNIYSD